MRRHTSRPVRDTLIGGGSLAFAGFVLLGAAANALDLVWPGAAWDSWLRASSSLVMCALLAETAGFSLISAGFLGHGGARARRIRIGALVVGASYLALFVSATVARGSDSPWIQPLGVIRLVSYLAAAVAAVLVARAFREGLAAKDGTNDRDRRLSWAGLCFGVHAGLWVVSDLNLHWHSLGEGSTSALSLTAHLALFVAALTAAFGFFEAGRSKRSDQARASRRAVFLAVSAAALLVAGVLQLTIDTTSMRPYDLSGMDPRDSAFVWLWVLGDLSMVIAGLCLGIAFVLCRSRTACGEPEPIREMD